MSNTPRPPSLTRGGFDEAGLGPTLGPLVIGGFVTRVAKPKPKPKPGARARASDRDDWGPCDDLRGPLAALIGEPGCRDGRIEVGDSKKIHVGAHKLARIERTALATVAWIHGHVPATAHALLELVAPATWERAGDRRAPWWSKRALSERLPIACDRAELEQLGAQLEQLGRKVAVTPLWYRADVISAARINRELTLEHALEHGTKNTWATDAVLRMTKLAVDQLEPHDTTTLAIWCDKAGGRAAYAGPLRRAYPELDDAAADMPLFGAPVSRLEQLEQVRERSHYRIQSSQRRLELGFVMGGDRCDPRISWASILAKYLRELIMRSLNRHFAARVPGLRPTAGYPEDGQRFIAEVEAALGPDGGLERAMWIRSK